MGHEYTSKFELTDYVVRTTKEMIGLQLAKPIVPIYRDPNAIQEEDKVTDEEKTEEISKNFTDKTNLLFEYIEKTYFDGDLDEETMRLIQKMHEAENYQPSEKKKVEYGFEAIFLNNQK